MNKSDQFAKWTDFGEYPGNSADPIEDKLRGLHFYASAQRVPFERGAIFFVPIGLESSTRQEMEELWRKMEDAWHKRYGGSPKGTDIFPEYTLIIGPGTEPSVAILMDGYHFRQTVFQNVRIVYRGGPVALENVGFVNCVFDLPTNPETVRFAISVLGEQREVKFEAGP